MHIYLPPDYEKNTDTTYPVPYLNHGGGDDDSKWTSADQRNGGNAQVTARTKDDSRIYTGQTICSFPLRPC
jgi:hypothetical protein